MMQPLMIALLTATAVSAQVNAINSAGYRPPATPEVAPGQVITLFLDVTAPPVAEPVVASMLPLPFTLGGFTVELRQTFSEPLPVPIQAVYAIDSCTSALGCKKLAAITVQTPFELVPNVPGSRMPANFGVFTVTGNGLAGEIFPIEAVPASIHIVNTCDATLPPVSGECMPAVFRPDGSRVSDANRATAGEILTIHALGLGLPATAVRTGQAPVADVEVDEVAVVVDSAPPQAAAAKLAGGAVGLYHVSFPAPAVTAPTAISVQIRRGASFDSVTIPMAPQPTAWRRLECPHLRALWFGKTVGQAFSPALALDQDQSGAQQTPGEKQHASLIAFVTVGRRNRLPHVP